jgi:hypothetical protein
MPLIKQGDIALTLFDEISIKSSGASKVLDLNIKG